MKNFPLSTSSLLMTVVWDMNERQTSEKGHLHEFKRTSKTVTGGHVLDNEKTDGLCVF
jgi:hypothetical protein